MQQTLDIPIIGQYQQDIVRTPDGLIWVYGKGTQDALAIYHEMEPPGASIHDYICGHFKPGLVFLDIGAHVGHYSVRAAAAGCTVYAVEPNPENGAQLRLNMRANKITGLTLWVVAAWDRRELLPIKGDSRMDVFRAGVGSVMSGESQVPMGITAAGMPLDELLAGVERVDLVKMDVEGADLRALDGMTASLERLRPELVIEDHSQYGYFEAAELDERCERLSGYQWRAETYPTGQYRIGVPITGG